MYVCMCLGEGSGEFLRIKLDFGICTSSKGWSLCIAFNLYTEESNEEPETDEPRVCEVYFCAQVCVQKGSVSGEGEYLFCLHWIICITEEPRDVQVCRHNPLSQKVFYRNTSIPRDIPSLSHRVYLTLYTTPRLSSPA